MVYRMITFDKICVENSCNEFSADVLSKIIKICAHKKLDTVIQATK